MVLLGVLALFVAIFGCAEAPPRADWPWAFDREAAIGRLEERCEAGPSAESWYAITLRGQKIGFLAEKVYRHVRAGRPVYVFESVSLCHVAYGQEEHVATLTRAFFVDRDTLSTLAFHVEKRDGALVTTYEGAYDGARLTIHTETPGSQNDEVFSVDCLMPEQLARVALVASGMDTDAHVGFTDFDSKLGAPAQRRLVLENPADTAPWCMTLSHLGDDGTAQTFFLDDDGRPMRVDLGNGLALVKATRAEATADIALPLDIRALGTIRTAREIVDPAHVSSLVVRLRLPEWQELPLHWAATIEPVAGRDDTVILTNVACTSDEPPPDSPKTEPSQAAAPPAGLEATPYVESGDPLIIEAAREAVGDAADTGEQCRRLIRWCGTHLNRTGGIQALASAKAALVSRQGDCTERAFLFAALAHSLGIP
ncbi:MAG: transglutaminase domain-containing protein, partial [Candidatus Hydrogenedentes bacterium]|nr:transglutaminase domain-containing protein [Candidatus Hydrogenedentota bacterium]